MREIKKKRKQFIKHLLIHINDLVFNVDIDEITEELNGKTNRSMYTHLYSQNIFSIIRFKQKEVSGKKKISLNNYIIFVVINTLICLYH